jgi:hypothetical protein
MLTDEGIEAARDCLSRSGLDLTDKQSINSVAQNSLQGLSSSDMDDVSTTYNQPMLALNKLKNVTKVITLFSSSISYLLYTCVYNLGLKALSLLLLFVV